MSFTRKFLRRQTAAGRRKVRKLRRVKQRYELWRDGKLAEERRARRAEAKLERKRARL